MEHTVLEQILDGTIKPNDVPFETLRNITNNFSTNRIIGEGGFGTVYKGVLRNRDVAVKKIMSSMTIDEKLFRREVDSLMEVNHQNVVKFLGFCSHTEETAVRNPESRGYIYAEKRERLLCFEYISNGSLDKYITDELRGLEWETRYQVIKGICTGLYYLHREKHILHMDLKPANILLDNQMVPKITDFGLSRPTENSRTSNHFSSPGYGAPENRFGDGRLSVKYDIYSLGVIIIELVSGHKGICDDKPNILRRWRHRWNKSATETPIAYQHQVTKCIDIGIMCQSDDPYKRPSISDIMNEIGEMESTNNHIRNGDEPTIGQTNSDSWADDMLGVEPLDLHFANSDHNNKHASSSCSVELSNNTDGFIAFNIQTNSPLPYCIYPNNNIVPPQSKLTVNITLPEATQHRYKQYKEKFIVHSTKVNQNLAAKDIYQEMFDKGKYVDKVDLAVIHEGLLALTVNSSSGRFSSLPGPSSARGALDVVIVYAFDCSTCTPAWYAVDNGVFWLVQEKLTKFTDSCLGYIYVMLTGNTYTYDMKIVDSAETRATGYTGFARRRVTCYKNMASGLWEAHTMISNRGYENGIILLFSDGLECKGDFFDGAENFVSKVPVHTFTLDDGDAYNHVLRSIASKSPGGRFHTTPVPERPALSTAFSKLLDNIFSGTPEYDERPPSPISGMGPLHVVIVYAFDCTVSTRAWYTVDTGVFWLVQEKLTHFTDSCMGYIYVMSTPNTYTSDMKLVDPNETKATGYTGFAWHPRLDCTKNMASGLPQAHKMIRNCGHLNGMILFFSDGLINKGDFFDGTDNFVSEFPVHTFTLGGDAYNHGLQAIADKSPGGTFNPLPVPERPQLSVPFSQLLDRLLGDIKD